MMFTYAILAMSLLVQSPLVVWAVVDWVRTARWARTNGWASLLDAMHQNQPRHVAALYAIYRDGLRVAQRRAVEMYLDAERERVGQSNLEWCIVNVTPVPEWQGEGAEGQAVDGTEEKPAHEK